MHTHVVDIEPKLNKPAAAAANPSRARAHAAASLLPSESQNLDSEIESKELESLSTRNGKVQNANEGVGLVEEAFEEDAVGAARQFVLQ